MRLSIKQGAFSRGLAVVNRAASPRSTLPILSNILMSTDSGKLKLSATNLEVGISCWVDATILEEGAITLPARTLVDMVNSFNPEEIYVAVNDSTQTAEIKTLDAVHEVKGIHASDFPVMTVPNLADGIDLNLDNFKRLIQQVSFAASTDNIRPALNSVKLEVSGRKLTLTATDGYRLSIKEEMMLDPVNKDFDILVPVSAMDELARIDPSGEILTVVVPDGGGRVVFHTNEVVLESRLIEGKYPNVRDIIPRGYRTRTTVLASELLKACKQAQIIARDGNNVAKLIIAQGIDDEGEIEIKAQTETTGNSDIKTPATVEGEGLQLSFDVRFLREALEAIKATEITIDTNASNSAAIFRPVGDEGYLHVIMPRVS